MMTSFKSYIFLILFLFAEVQLFAGEKPDENTKGITITLSMDTNVYCEMQQVWLSAKFKNEGTKPDSVPELDIYGLFGSMEIKKDNNEKLQYNGSYPSSVGIYYETLEAGQEINIDIPIRYYFGVFDKYSSVLPLSGGFISEGEYQVSAKVVLNRETKKAIISNTLIFDVVIPGDSEQNCFNELKRIYGLKMENIQEKELKVSSYKKFIEEYSSSVFYDEVFYHYIAMKYYLGKSDFDPEIIYEIQFYLENRSNTIESMKLCRYYGDALIRFGSKDEARNKLNELKLRFPGSRLSEGIENTLKSHLFVQ